MNTGKQKVLFIRGADFVTAARIPLAVAFWMVETPLARSAILLLAALSDGADGLWARRVGGSRIGVVLDPVCDKIFMLVAFLVVLKSGALSLLSIAFVLIRDIVAATALIVTWVQRKPRALPARAGGKLVTVGQLLTLGAFVIESNWIGPLAWVTGFVSLYAIFDYTREALKK